MTDVESANVVKILVAGQRGMGKTTELRRFESMLDAMNGFQPVFLQFGAQERINDETLIYTMAQALLIKSNLKVGKGDPLWNWFDTEESVSSYSESRGGSVSVGGNLPLIGAKGSIQTGRDTKRTKTHKVIKNKPELLDAFNRIIQKAKEKNGAQIVFIVDDIDKIQDTVSVEGTFVSSAHTLGLIDAPCVFTVPYTYATSSFNRLASLPYTSIHRVPAVAINSRSGLQQLDNCEFMSQVLKRRLTVNPFSDEEIQRIIDYSGGVIVDALRLARGVLKQIVLGDEHKVAELIEDEFQKIADEYRYQFDKPILWRKLQKFCEAVDPALFLTDETTLDLVCKMIVIEYRDRTTWHSVHPAVRRLYEQNKVALASVLGQFDA
ncbi:MAG: hypothetical protein ABSF70_18140 [Terracidiphilus sp.]|jgi:hypothetical protein